MGDLLLFVGGLAPVKVTRIAQWTILSLALGHLNPTPHHTCNDLQLSASRTNPGLLGLSATAPDNLEEKETARRLGGTVCKHMDGWVYTATPTAL
jgi:hypothetical protein